MRIIDPLGVEPKWSFIFIFTNIIIINTYIIIYYIINTVFINNNIRHQNKKTYQIQWFFALSNMFNIIFATFINYICCIYVFKWLKIAINPICGGGGSGLCIVRCKYDIVIIIFATFFEGIVI